MRNAGRRRNAFAFSGEEHVQARRPALESSKRTRGTKLNLRLVGGRSSMISLMFVIRLMKPESLDLMFVLEKFELLVGACAA